MTSEGGEGEGLSSFETEEIALQYLKDHVPAQKDESTADLTPLKQKLFDTPSEVTAGHHEFVGRNGLKVSYELVKSNDSFDTCYSDLKGDPAIQGTWQPIFYMRDLTVESPNFHYSLKYPAKQEHARIEDIYWLPDLGSGDSDLSHDYVNLSKKSIYLLAQDGFFSRPLDLLGFFHEVGHIETYPMLPFNQDSTTHDFFGNRKPRTARMTAHELRREEYANNWAKRNTTKLFEDLGITQEQVDGFYDNVQLRSYHNVARRVLDASTKPPQPAGN